jgi:glutamate-1-semialdehyde 2,1-aminomutase
MTAPDPESDEQSQTTRGHYYDKTERSRDLHEEASGYMPGGNARSGLYHAPYPSFIESAHGCRVTDVDGNEYLDFINNMTSLVHGHGAPSCIDPAIDVLENSSAPGGPTRHEVDFAHHMCERVPGLDGIQMTNSGTEATMTAIRAARAYTGKTTIAKFEGTYHGSHNDVMMSVRPSRDLAGPPERPNSVPATSGLPESTGEEVIALPFNDADATLERLEAQLPDLAGVIIAPYMGTWIVPANEEFLTALAEFTDEHDVPLIVDEVVSFRVAYGGPHTEFGIEPDLMTFGKMISGGVPGGAFGGRDGVMGNFGRDGPIDMYHSGTYTGNPLMAAAGLGSLSAFDESEVDRLNAMCRSLVEQCREVASDRGIALEVTRAGSLFSFWLSSRPVENYRDIARTSRDLEKQLYFELLREGVRISTPKLLGSLSTPMTDREIEEFTDAFDTALGRLKPRVREHAPSLVTD